MFEYWGGRSVEYCCSELGSDADFQIDKGGGGGERQFIVFLHRRHNNQTQ